MPLSRTQLVPRPELRKDPRLHIVASEGETEKAYFAIFDQHKNVQVVVLTPDKETSLSAPQYVFQRAEEIRTGYRLTVNDTLWLMLDTDRWPRPQLSDLCREADQKGIRLAISNPCFELWLLLHHGDADPADANCKAVKARFVTLAELGQGKVSVDSKRYLPHLQAAIQRAKALDTPPAHRIPAHPGTHVYKLVELLL